VAQPLSVNIASPAAGALVESVVCVLVQAAFTDRATARVNQSRIAIEVLRKALDNAADPGTEPGQRVRGGRPGDGQW
jgi:hypothetical protein